MRYPIAEMTGHLLLTTQGTWWATWRLTPQTYNKPLAEKRMIAGLHTALMRVLQGEALLHSVIVPDDPTEVVERMMDGLDMEQVPGWAAECDATLDELDQLPLGQRLYWLSVPLSNPGQRAWRAPAAAAWRGLTDLLDLPAGHTPSAEHAFRAAQAAAIEDLIPAPFAPERVSVAENVWIRTHAARRGLIDLPCPRGGGLVEELIVSSPAAMTMPVLDPGARTDSEPPARLDLRGQRVLKVWDLPGADTHGFPPSYQCLMTVKATPAGGLTFPGSEVFLALDRSGIDVDWAIPLRVNSRAKVLKRNRRVMRELNEQWNQREAEAATGLRELSLAHELLTEYDARFAEERDEVEIEHTFIFAVAAAATYDDQPDIEVRQMALDQADALAKYMYDQCGFTLERLPGAEEELWWAMQPGGRRTALIRAKAQFTTATQFAYLVPIITHRLGGERGPLVLTTIGTTRPRPGHLDPAGYAELDMSGAVMAVGEMGAGKSVLQKTLASHLVDRGGQFWAIDKSEQGEWVPLARACDSHLIVDPLDPEVTMDPLRILSLEQGCDVARSVLTILLNLDAQDRLGLLLSKVVHPTYLTTHDIHGLGELNTHLATGLCDMDGAVELGERLTIWAETPIARVLFADLPPAPLDVDATVWRTQGMEQPTLEQMSHAHLFRQMPLERIFGRAYYRLLFGLARRLCFADPAVETAFIVDELYDAMQNFENVDDAQHFVRRGRRGKAQLIAGTHAPADTEDDVLSGLIPTRFAFRHRDDALARASLQWLGLDPEKDPDFAEILKDLKENTAPLLDEKSGVPLERRGECYLRDAFGNFGKARILRPAQPHRRTATVSTPPTARSTR